MVGVAIVLRPKPASAAPAAPQPAGVLRFPAPPDGMPWNTYSVITLTRQLEYNAFAVADQFYGFPTIEADGILGPETCAALTENIYFIQPNYPGAPPVACTDGSWRVPA